MKRLLVSMVAVLAMTVGVVGPAAATSAKSPTPVAVKRAILTPAQAASAVGMTTVLTGGRAKCISHKWPQAKKMCGREFTQPATAPAAVPAPKASYVITYPSSGAATRQLAVVRKMDYGGGVRHLAKGARQDVWVQDAAADGSGGRLAVRRVIGSMHVLVTCSLATSVAAAYRCADRLAAAQIAKLKRNGLR